ncbi:hypothetical protein QJQ45_007960 [Haematococcus lacustris]|nr:hypothetical protein QJQ45_007960 [Haematococcus lacustris]
MPADGILLLVIRAEEIRRCAIGFSPCGTTHTCLASSGKASHTSHLGGKPGVPQPLTSRIVRELLASQKRWVITGPQPDVHKAHTTPVMQSYFLAPLQCNQTVAGLLILGHSKPMFFEDPSWEMAGEVAATWLSRLFIDGQLTSYCAIQQCISSCNSLSDLAKAVSWTVMQQQLQALHQSPLQCRVAFIRNDAASALLFDNLWHQGPEPDASRSRKSSYTQGDATNITHLASLSNHPATELAGSSAAQNSDLQPLSTRPTHPRILGLVQRPAQLCSQLQHWGPGALGAADHRSTARQPGSLAGPSAPGPLGLITVPPYSTRNSLQQATGPSAALTGPTTTSQPHPSVPNESPVSLHQPVVDRDPVTVTPTSLLSEAQGTCVPLTNTVLGEALKAKQAVWVSDCTAFMQNSRNPHQDVYLATSQEAAGCMVVCPMYHHDRPFMALYLNMSQRYSTQVLETVGQALLETCAVMEPAIWHLLHGELDFEWRYLQTQVLGGPGSSSELQAGERILLSAFSSAARSRASPCLLRPPSTAQETPRLGWAGLGQRVSVKVWDMEGDENMSQACERGAAACTAPMPAAAAPAAAAPAAAAVVSVSTVVAAALSRIAKADDTAPRVSSSVLMQCWEQELPSLAGANKISSLSEMGKFPDSPNAIPAVPDVVGSSPLALATMPASTLASTMASPMPKPSPGAKQALPPTTGAKEPQSALITNSLLIAAYTPVPARYLPTESASAVGPAATSHLSTPLSSCAPPSSQPTRSSQPQLHSLGQFMLKGLALSGAPSSLPSPGASPKVPVLQQCLRDHSPDSRSASRRHSPQLLASSSQATLSPTQSLPVPSPHPLTQVQGSGAGTQDAEAGRQEGQRRGPALRAALLGRELKVALLGLLNWDIGHKRRALLGARPAPSPEQGTLVGRTVSCTVGPGGAGEGSRRAARRWLPKPGHQSGAVSPQEGSFTDLTRSCADMNEFLPRYNSVSAANPASPTPTPDRYGKPALLPLARPGSHHLQVPSWPSSPSPGASSSKPRLVIPCPLATVLNQAGPTRANQERPGSTKDAAEEGACDSQTTRSLGGFNRTPGKQRQPSFRVNRSPMASSSARRIGALISGLQGKVQEAQRHQLQARAESLHQDELGNISISAKIGAGGFGACYRGLYQGTEAAIKVVHDRHGSATEVFRNAVELAVLSTLSHPNIVQVLTYFTDVGVSYPSADDLMSGASEPLTLHPAEQLAAYEAFLEHQQEEQQRQRQQEQQQQQQQQQGPEGQQQQPQQLLKTQYQLPPSMLMPSNQGLSSQCPSPHAPPAPTPPAPAQRIKRALVICMEYCDMGTLCDAVQQGAFHDHTAATPEAAPRWPAIYQTLLELALALRYLHSLSLVHRDVKLQNVLLKSHSNDPRGFTCKLSDFGLVKLNSDQQHSCVSSSSSVSQLSNLQPDGHGSHGLLPAITFKPWSEVFANPGPEGTQQNKKPPQASPQGAAPAPVPASFHFASPRPRRRYSGTVTHLPPEAFASGEANSLQPHGPGLMSRTMVTLTAGPPVAPLRVLVLLIDLTCTRRGSVMHCVEGARVRPPYTSLTHLVCCLSNPQMAPQHLGSHP